MAYDTFADLASGGSPAGQTWLNGTNVWANPQTWLRGDGNGNANCSGVNATQLVSANFNKLTGQNGFAVFFSIAAGRPANSIAMGIMLDAPAGADQYVPSSGVWAEIGSYNVLSVKDQSNGTKAEAPYTIANDTQYCLEVFKTNNANNREYKVNLYASSGAVRGSLLATATHTINTARPEAANRTLLTAPTTSMPLLTIYRIESVPLEPAVLPTGTITNQPAPNGQSQRFVGTTTNATGGTFTLTGSNGGVTVGPSAFTVTSNAFDFTVNNLVPGDYAPTLTVTGDGGTAAVSGTSSFAILGVSGGGTLPDVGSVPAVVPNAPTNVVAVAGDGTVSVNCTPPFDGGSPITLYEVLASTGQIGTGATVPVVLSMPNGVPATFQIRAHNSVGPGQYSNNSNQVTPQANVTVPGAPSLLATAGPNSITVDVTPPAFNGGSAITSYTVTLSTGESLTQAAGPFVFNGLSTIPRHAVGYATNSSGNGPNSQPSNTVTPTQILTAPGAPTALVAVAGPARITVNYSAPADDGGSPILEYLGTLSTGEESSSTTTSMVFNGLSANVARTVTISARNAIGTGPASVASNSVTPTEPIPEVTGVSILPQQINMVGGTTNQFVGIVQGIYSPPQGLLWSCSGGTIDATGLYAAPAPTIINQYFTVTATSQYDPDFSATCNVTVLADTESGQNGNRIPVRHFASNVINRFGVAIEGAFVTVQNTATGEKAVLFSDKTLTTQIFNPIITDDEGYFEFYVEAQQCSYSVRGSGIEPYTREDIFDIIENVDLTPIARALQALDVGKVSTDQLANAVAPLASTASVAELAADIAAIEAALPVFAANPPVEVKRFVTGGAGTEADPWTGWDTAISWAAATQYDFEDGVYAYATSPNFARNFLSLRGRKNTVLKHTGTGNALLVDAGTATTAVVVGLDISVKVQGNLNSANGLFMRGVAQSKVDIDFDNIPGICVQEVSCILNECKYTSSPTNRNRSVQPTSLLITGRRGTGIGCAGNKYTLVAENCTGDGINLLFCRNSVISGVSQFNNIGLRVTFNSEQLTFVNFVAGNNSSADVIAAGPYHKFDNCRVTGTFSLHGDHNTVIGGVFDHINAAGKNSQFGPLVYGINGGQFNEAAIGITKRNMYNAQKASFDVDAVNRIRELTVTGRTTLSNETLVVGDGQIVKNPEGQVFIGTSTANGAARLQLWNGKNTTTDQNFRSTMQDNAYVATSYHMICQTGGSDVLRVAGNGNVTNVNNSYAAISDASLKQNVVDATPKLMDLLNVRVVNYDLIDDPNHEKLLGVIAQELEAIFPGMVETVNGVKSVKYSVFVPMLIKALQETNARIDNL